MRKAMTVGETIANHHWRDAFSVARDANKPFADSNLGRAFNAMLNAHARAWELAGNEHASDRAIQAAEDRNDEAQRTFLTLMHRAIKTGSFL